MFYLIGIGLEDETDITVKGLSIVKKCKKVYLEEYTSILLVSKEKLESFYGRSLIPADRQVVQEKAKEIIQEALEEDISLIVVGDSLTATTHIELLSIAKKMNIPTKVIHNASILTSVSTCGLPLYNYGQTVSIPFFTDRWKPESFYDRILKNKENGLHTLCLLDIKIKERKDENKQEFLPSRFMTINKAIEQILFLSEKRINKNITENTIGIGMARVGTKNEKIVVSLLKDLLKTDFGDPLHSLIIPGEITHYEKEFFETMFGFTY